MVKTLEQDLKEVEDKGLLYATIDNYNGLIGALISGRVNKKLSTDLLMTFLAVAGLFLVNNIKRL